MADIIHANVKENQTGHKHMLRLAQLVNENKDIIKGQSGFGITSETKGDTVLKYHYHQVFLQCLRSKADCRKQLF